MSFIYADSCIFIYLIEGNFSQKRKVKKRLALSDSKPNVIGFSDLSRMECLIHPVRTGNILLQNAYERLFNGQYLRYIPISSEIFERATELRASFGVKTPDALHIAAAEIGRCDIFLTNDYRLEKVNTKITIETL